MEEVRLMKGNEALAEAAIRCGCDGYFGYPITPQSEVMETLMLLKPWETTGMVVMQAESEVASINMVYAGAGCGKTKVLTTRIANLVKSGVSPYEILAVTFTNKAAKEMVERLSKMIGEDKAKKMWIGTFHSISGRILRTDIQEYKDEEGKTYDNKFVIYDDTDSNAILKNAIKKCSLDEKIYQPKLLKTIISNAKNKMQDAYTYATRARDFRTEKYAQIFMEYQKQLQKKRSNYQGGR